MTTAIDDMKRYFTGAESSTDDIEKEDVAAGRSRQDEVDKGHWRADHATFAQARKEEKAERRGENGKGTAKAAGGEIAEHATREAVKHALRRAGDSATLVDEAREEVGFAHTAGMAVLEMVQGLRRDFKWGDELKTRADVDARDVTMDHLLDLDPAFRDKDLQRFGDIVGSDARYKTAGGSLTELGKKRLPEWQAAADAGAYAALAAMHEGGKDAFLKSHPDVAKRFEADIAYNKGFENAMYLANDPAKLAALKDKLHERDPRLLSAATVRG